MNLGALLARAMDVLGDDPADPREFPRQPLVDAANRGCLAFRVACHEVWRRADLAVIANQAEYTIPPEILSLQRVAYDDETLEARASNTLQSRDSEWMTRPGEPVSWTSYGLDYNKFRLWPIPTVGSDETFTFSSDYGVIVRYSDGADFTLTSEFGLMTVLEGVTFTEDHGELFYVSAPETESLTLWGTDRPTTLVDDGQEIPIRKPWQIAILWFVLWQAYDDEGDHHNGILSAWYRDQWFDVVRRCREHVGSPVATQVHKLRGAGTGDVDGLRYGDVIVNGNPVSVTW